MVIRCTISIEEAIIVIYSYSIALTLALASLALTYLAQKFVLSVLLRVYPSSDQRIPYPIRMLLAGIGIGILAARLYPSGISEFKVCSEIIRDTLITISLFLTSLLIVERMSFIRHNNTFQLMVTSSIGAIGIGLGAAAFVVIAKHFWDIKFPNPIPQNQQIWGQSVDWVVVVTNGWMGDSSTQIPLMIVLEDSARERRPLVDASLGMTPAFLLDWAITLPWFAAMARLAKKHAQSDVTHAALNSNLQKVRGIGFLPIVWTVGLLGGFLMFLLGHHAVWQKSFWRPIFTILLYGCIGGSGYLMAKRRFLVGDQKFRSSALALAVGGFGIVIGTKLRIANIQEQINPFLVLMFCGFGALLGHCLALLVVGRILLRRPLGHIFLASMCSIGGLASAPAVAEEYNSNYIDAAYVSALWCNLLSLPITWIIWSLFAP